MSKSNRDIRQAKRTNQPKPDGANARARARAEAEAAARKRRDLKVVVSLGVALVVLAAAAGIGYAVWRATASSEAETAAVEQRVTLTNGQPIVYGDPAAPKTVDIYLDFMCPHCAQFEQSMGTTVTQLIDSGEVKVAYHPLSFMQRPGGSVTRANAMACAAEEGFGQALMSQMFANQRLNWSDQQIVELGKQLAPDNTAFETCVTRRQHQDWVDSIDAAPTPPDFGGTPAIYVGDQQIPWSTQMSPQQFTEAVKAA